MSSEQQPKLLVSCISPNRNTAQIEVVHEVILLTCLTSICSRKNFTTCSVSSAQALEHNLQL